MSSNGISSYLFSNINYSKYLPILTPIQIYNTDINDIDLSREATKNTNKPK
jgi:hypothetical protein